jgi:hypothetical protein
MRIRSGKIGTNMNFLCKIGLHKYKFKKFYPEWLQPKGNGCCLQDFRVWIEKCERCGKEKDFNDLIK